jgi:hypothetical protein
VLPLYEGNGCNTQQSKVYCFRPGYAPIFIKITNCTMFVVEKILRTASLNWQILGGAHQINYAPVLGL